MRISYEGKLKETIVEGGRHFKRGVVVTVDDVFGQKLVSGAPFKKHPAEVVAPPVETFEEKPIKIKGKEAK